MLEMCTDCDGTGVIEILGDGDNFEVDVIGEKVCRKCDGLGEVEDDQSPDRPLNEERE